jgi:membrane protein
MGDNKQHTGRSAERPREIPARGWKEVLLRVKDDFSNDYLDVVSAGVGFYFFLALFPLIATAIAIYGLVFDPAQVEQHINQLSGVLPEQAHGLISEGLQNLTQQSDQGLGLALVISILLSLWAANQGTKALFDGINIAYNEKIERGFIKNNAISLLVTLGVMVVGFICAILVIAFPAFIGTLGLPGTLETAISLLRWPLLFAIVIFSIAMLYKIAPDRDKPQFKWVSWGAIFATCIWIIGSLLFSLYVNNFGDFDATYGSVAAVIILMLWFQLTGISILFGAEINSEMEHQTVKDTTVGEPMPMGSREAYHADHVASKEPAQEIQPEKKQDEKKDGEKISPDRESIKRDRKKRYRYRPPRPKNQDIKDKGEKS